MTTMGCSCSDHTSDHAQRVDDLLASVGLKEVAEQGREAIAEAGRALEQQNRAERAESLGFGAEVSTIHLDAAKRSNRRAQEQIQTVLARMDHTREADDWSGHVERVRAAFKEQNGPEKLDDLRADIRLRLLDDGTGLSATVAELSMACLDGAIKAASAGDLNEVVAHMQGTMEGSLRGFASPEMGRQSIGLGLFDDKPAGGSPPIGGGDTGWCIALAACLAWAYSSLIASMIACFAFIWCVCCWHLAILGTFFAHQLACVTILAPLCNRKTG